MYGGMGERQDEVNTSVEAQMPEMEDGLYKTHRNLRWCSLISFLIGFGVAVISGGQLVRGSDGISTVIADDGTRFVVHGDSLRGK